MSSHLLLTGGAGPGGERLDVLVDAAAGTVAEVAPAIEGARVAHVAEVADCTGMTLLPAPAEPHAHLDKALSHGRAPNPAGDLQGAIDAWMAYRPQLTEDDILARAREAALELVAHGTTAIRTHVDVGEGIELRAVHPLVALREELRAQGLADLQVVALAGRPYTGREGEANLARLRAAMDAGADVVGGAPHLDPDPAGSTRALVAVAEELGAPIDLHTDERLDADALSLRELIADAAAGRLPHGAVASHCVSLGVQSQELQREIARDAAAAGVSIVALPQTNLYLQGRGVPSSTPRGLTAVRALLDAGACLAAGADNVRDPFNPVGRSDALETAALLITVGHLTPDEAWAAVSSGARRAMGLPVAALEPGAPAEILAVRGAGLADAIARGSEERLVVHAGRVVARTAVTTSLHPLPSDPAVPALT